ncbi:MAG TPA: hypothetical protein PLF26_08250, partial [Blastocatellia bacterium]|nr:hypothetical protein [Blastocatellia bacterium]
VRYAYGLAWAVSVCFGRAHFGGHRCAPLTLLSCVVWVGLLSGLGYFFTGSIEKLIGDIRHLERFALVIGVLIVIFFVVKHYRLGRRVIEE